MPLPKDIINFHKEALKLLLDFYLKNGYNTVEKINSINGKSKLEDSLWKIPEAEGKHKQRYISKAVKDVRDLLDEIGEKENHKSIFTAKQLKNGINSSQITMPSLVIDYYKTQLEHVVEKSILIEMLIKNPKNLDKIIDTYNVGCTVFKNEHDLLPDKVFVKNDIWTRYKSAGIKVWDRKNNKWAY